jgi:hypothetical protein
VVAVEVLFFTFAQVALVPKLRKIERDGWLDVDGIRRFPVMAWLDSVLHGLGWVANHVTAILLVAVGAWGLFEWRVRGENKPFMRLAALGTSALGLAVGALFVSAALVLPFLLGMPGMARLSVPTAVRQMATVDESVTALEQTIPKKDWEVIQQDAARASRALDRLAEAVEATPALTPKDAGPTVDELRARLKAANESLLEAQNAIRAKDTSRLETALKKFHELYGPLGKAAANPGK